MAIARDRPWGVVLRVRIEAGPQVFVKLPGPACRHELVLLPELAVRFPGVVPDVLAVDRARGWLLLADHGHRMADALAPSEQVRIVESLLPKLAEIQRTTLAEVPRWLEVGVPDRRVIGLPTQLEELLHGCLDRFRGVLDLARRACDALQATMAIDALDHADLHAGNVLVRAGDARIGDWGDACITHPFVTVFEPFHFVVPAADRPRVRDAYLEVWGNPVALRAPFDAACWLGNVVRALNVAHEAPTGRDEPEVAELLARALSGP